MKTIIKNKTICDIKISVNHTGYLILVFFTKILLLTCYKSLYKIAMIKRGIILSSYIYEMQIFILYKT